MKTDWINLRNQLISSTPWTNVYGIGRSLLALGTFLTLAFNDIHILFKPTLISLQVPNVIGIGRFGLFNLMADYLLLAQILSVVVLLLVIIGWRPRVTAVLHWYVTASFAAGAATIDGGDHVSTVLTLLMLPVALTDPRRWHWSTLDPTPAKSPYACILAGSASFVIRIQVAIIYLHAAVGKWSVPEWADGTSLFYWFTDPSFGLASHIKPLIFWLLLYPTSVTLLTWGIIVLEFVLFLGLSANRRFRGYLLVIGIFFHLMIGVVHGLISFALAMTAALILYLRPFDQRFKFKLSLPKFSFRQYIHKGKPVLRSVK
ncbi:MAG: sporulation-delaying protein SdpB family protein [Bacteroidota bacterium]